MKALKSKTIWKAIVTGLAGVMIAVLTEYDLVGYIFIVNAGADAILRALTTKPLAEK